MLYMRSLYARSQAVVRTLRVGVVPDATVDAEALIEVGELFSAEPKRRFARVAVVVVAPQVPDTDVDARIGDFDTETRIERGVASGEGRNNRRAVAANDRHRAVGSRRQHAAVARVRILELLQVARDHPGQTDRVEFPRAVDLVRCTVAGVTGAELVVDLRREDVVAGDVQVLIRWA